MIVSFFRRLFVTITMLIMLWGAGFAWFVTRIPTETSANATHADAIIVLTGGGLRLERGVALLLAGYAPKLFVSGVQQGVDLPTLLHKQDVSKLSIAIPTDRIELGYYARSTLQNAEEIKVWVTKHNAHVIRLVTASYHMPRSLYVLHQAIPGLFIIPDPVFPAEFGEHWWLSTSSIRLVLSEYHKYVASVVADMLGITSEE